MLLYLFSHLFRFFFPSSLRFRWKQSRFSGKYISMRQELRLNGCDEHGQYQHTNIMGCIWYGFYSVSLSDYANSTTFSAILPQCHWLLKDIRMMLKFRRTMWTWRNWKIMGIFVNFTVFGMGKSPSYLRKLFAFRSFVWRGPVEDAITAVRGIVGIASNRPT